MANMDLSDRKNFTIFLVIDIVLTVVLTILGIFLLPLIGWVFDDGELIEILFSIPMVGAMILMIIWLVLFFINIRKGRNKRWKLLCVILSLGIICGTHMLIFYEWKCSLLYSSHRWGNCMVSSGGCYNMFGIEKFRGGEVYRVYDEKGRKKIVRFFESDGETDVVDFYGEDVEVQWHQMNIWEYDIYGDYVGKVKSDNICKWFELPDSFVSEYNLDGEYFYDGKFYDHGWNGGIDVRDVVLKDSRDLLIEEGFIFE
ncbi:MAG: hypothetical protein IKH61_03910 [Bacteroidales bacterium]|nr:hypothetical protein [Bacteroidales bacterium]